MGPTPISTLCCHIGIPLVHKWQIVKKASFKRGKKLSLNLRGAFE